MKKWMIGLLVISGLLAGCNNDDAKKEDHVSNNEGTSVEVKVDILTPEKAEANKEIELAAHVTQGGEDVDDANDVKFEVWESGMREDGQMIEGKLDGKGVYKTTITLDHDGVYYMFAHTNARGLHVMPKQKIIVGDPDMSTVKEESNGSSKGMEKMDMDDDSDSKSHDHK
ncbi:FixH family protein [Viridibacillus sp. YIM B01967]|uniref:FixH family protein n=1 Tax=Viridibacillus soli TaxID=2798301 RepID=A0ABS1HA27_9BACL|nr:FixH family protein [Viridibacillus soli]MBK3495972.1 FixH family protein [Viridibacillus soli]